MVVREVVVDSSAITKVEHAKRQRRSIVEKRRIVELAMQPGASVARVAREHGVNANMVFEAELASARRLLHGQPLALGQKLLE
jgi:transposase